MKNALLLLVSLAICSTVHAQSQERNWARSFSTKAQASSKVAHHDYQPTLCFQFDWSDSAGYWDSTMRVTYTYDPNGKLEEQTQEAHDVVGFVPSSRYRYSYDPQGRQDSMSYYTWSGSSWDIQTGSSYGWDAQDNLTSSAFYGWNSSVWDTTWAQRNYFQYVFGNVIAEERTETWSSATRQWEWSYLETFHYPTAAAWDTMSTYTYLSGNWEKDERYVDPVWYDFNLGLATEITLQVPDQFGVWTDFQRARCACGPYASSDCVYDEWSGSTWDSTYLIKLHTDQYEHDVLWEEFSWIGIWYQEFGSTSTYTYDPQGRTTEVIDQLFDGYIYRPESRETCPDFFLGKEEEQPLALSVAAYPNPCTDKLTFQWEQAMGGPVEITLMDFEGRIRTRTRAHIAAGKAELTVHMSETLPAGVYAYQLQTRQGTASGKVAVAR